MKSIRVFFQLLLIACLPLVGIAQLSPGTLDLSITLRDRYGKPMPQTLVEFIETQNRKKVSGTTDAEGNMRIMLKEGRYWQMNILDIRNYFYWQLEAFPGKNLTMTRTMTYDYEKYERESRPAVDRKALGLQTETQKQQPDVQPTAGMGVVKLEIKKADKSSLSNFPVAITCYKLAKTFSSSTNAAGIATFVVPLNNEYEIDIDGIPSFQYVDLPDRPGYRASKTFTYEPTIVSEKTVRDTTTQALSPDQEGTSGRVITRVTFKGGPDGVWRNEPVFLEVLGEKQVYRATTNQLGEARFLVPIGKKYMIHGRYEYNLDVLDMTRRRGIGYTTKVVSYKPIEKYQYPDRFIPNSDQVLVTAFQSFLQKQYPAPEPGTLLSLHGRWMQPFNSSSKDAVMNIVLTANESPDPSKAQALNIVFVVDKSGSMAGEDRIGNLIKSLMAFVERMRPQDIVSLVVFDDVEDVVVSARAIGTQRKVVLDAIHRLEAGNGTNIAVGLKAGYKELMKNFQAGRTNRLILLSDGFGGEPVEETLAAQAPYNSKGAECTAVGIGEDYNYALLKQLASNGGGLIAHVGDPTKLQAVFLEQLGSVLYPCAKDLELEVLFNKSLEYSQFYGFPLLEKSPGRLRLKMKDMYAGLNQLAFLRFRVVNPVPGIQDTPVTLRVKYKNLATGAMEHLEEQVPLVWKEASGELEMLFDENERKMYAIAVMNQSLKVMAEKFHTGDAGAARTALLDGLATLKKVYPGSNDADLNELQSQMELYLDIIAKQIK